MHWLRDRELLAPAFDGYHAVATALVIYGLAEVAGGYGFLAVFAGGLAFRRYERDHELNARVHEGAEQVEKFIELAVILLLGSMLTRDGLGDARLGGLGARGRAARRRSARWRCCSSLLGGQRRDRGRSRAFVAWFGVRGVGTLYYAATVVDRPARWPAARRSSWCGRRSRA